MSSSSHIIQVALLAPIDKMLSYEVEHSFFESLQLGDRLIAPLGKKKVVGIYLGHSSALAEQTTSYTLKKIEEKIETAPLFSKHLLKLIEWTANYYVAPIGEVFKLALPGSLGQVKSPKRREKKTTASSFNHKKKTFNLSLPQQKIFEQIKEESFVVHLIHGVTGSGKTEIYLKLIEKVLEQGGQVLCLIPEISLTPQTLARFQNYLGLGVSTYHSKLTPKEKENVWLGIKENKIQVLLGTRSALFAPFENLKMILIDEEHDSSYKQEERVRYHARDLGIMRAKFENIPIILGSATPSLESYYKAKIEKKYFYHELMCRYGQAVLPKIKFLHLSEIKHTKHILHPKLIAALEKNLEAHQQSILFLNRRGFSHFIQCFDCGWIAKCQNCEISLSFHKKIKELQCHYCEEHQRPPLFCPTCHSTEIKSVGIGVEKLEEEINKLFPNSKTARLDRDSIQKKGSLEKLLTQFKNQEIDLLIGTQIVSKGHDFPKVTCVGIINADLSLYFPDFRASENSYQLLTQTLGRAGRSSEPGEVYIQTSDFKHPVLQTLTKQDIHFFYEKELEIRKELLYPPYSRLILIRAQGTQKQKVIQAIETIHQIISNQKPQLFHQILGPAPCLVEKIRNRYRWQVLIKCHSPLSFIRSLKEEILQKRSGVSIHVDVDAYETV